MKNPAASCKVSSFKQTFSSVIARSEVTKQSDTECHSEPCPEPCRRGSEESQRDCFAKARDDSGNTVANYRELSS